MLRSFPPWHLWGASAPCAFACARAAATHSPGGTPTLLALSPRRRSPSGSLFSQLRLIHGQDVATARRAAGGVPADSPPRVSAPSRLSEGGVGRRGRGRPGVPARVRSPAALSRGAVCCHLRRTRRCLSSTPQAQASPPALTPFPRGSGGPGGTDLPGGGGGRARGVRPARGPVGYPGAPADGSARLWLGAGGRGGAAPPCTARRRPRGDPKRAGGGATGGGSPNRLRPLRPGLRGRFQGNLPTTINTPAAARGGPPLPRAACPAPEGRGWHAERCLGTVGAVPLPGTSLSVLLAAVLPQASPRPTRTGGRPPTRGWDPLPRRLPLTPRGTPARTADLSPRV